MSFIIFALAVLSVMVFRRMSDDYFQDEPS